MERDKLKNAAKNFCNLRFDADWKARDINALVDFTAKKLAEQRKAIAGGLEAKIKENGAEFHSGNQFMMAVCEYIETLKQQAGGRDGNS